MTEDAPAVVTLHIWGVAARDVPRAVVRMATDRPRLRRTEGVRFARLLGTGHARSFTVRDADPLHWALLVSWDAGTCADQFDDGATARAWGAFCTERLVVRMRPLRSRGRWDATTPFGTIGGATCEGPVASITRARIALSKARTFWRAVPPVAADVARAPGLRLAVGFAETPFRLQGTFSLWESAPALEAFAYGRDAHRDVVRRTDEVGWYAEELFARLSVLSVEGTFRGVTP